MFLTIRTSEGIHSTPYIIKTLKFKCKLFRHLLERNEKKQSPSLRPQHVASCFHHGINKMCLAHFGSDQHTCCKSLNMSVCWEIPHVVFKMSRVGFTFTVNSILAKLKLDVHLNH